MTAIQTITPAMVSEAVSGALRAAVPGRNARKMISQALGVSPRAVETWLAGEVAPNAATLLQMMAEYQTVCDQVLRLIGRTGSGTGTGGPLSADQRAMLADILRSLES